MSKSSDVIVIGAGAVGSACAYFAALAGLSVRVLERGRIVSGSSSGCEGNVLVSDKEAGPELDLSLYAQSIWRNDVAEHADLWEFDAKGGVVVSATDAGAQGLKELTVRQRKAGIIVEDIPVDEIRDYEPHIRPDLRGAAWYPQDCQVQPVLLASHLLMLARRLNPKNTVLTDTKVTGFLRDGDRITGVRTNQGEFTAGAVINATGALASELADLAGVSVPVLPRKGFVLITEPLPKTINHKVYAADYVAASLSSDGGLQTSPVIEGTPSGTVLIGSSRERVGFDRSVSLPVLRQEAQEAIAMFPMLAGVKVIRTYLGFRPYCPDHLPVIGPDTRAPGLWHACGHEGAGIGLSVATGKLITQSVRGEATDLDLTPFRPARFSEGNHADH